MFIWEDMWYKLYHAHMLASFANTRSPTGAGAALQRQLYRVCLHQAAQALPMLWHLPYFLGSNLMKQCIQEQSAWQPVRSAQAGNQSWHNGLA